MGWYRRVAACLAAAGALSGNASNAAAQSDASQFSYLEGAWCSEAHEDYRPGHPVIEIRQIRSVQPTADAQSGRTINIQLRSAVVSSVTGVVEMLGGWIEFRFQREGDRLVDPGVQVALTLPPERNALIYQYGESKAHRYARCGPAAAAMEEGRPLPPEVAVALRAAPSSPATQSAGAEAPLPPGQSAAATDGKLHLNRSHCFVLSKSGNGYLALRNQCSTPVNYTYCVLNPTTPQGRIFVCRTMTGTQLGQGGGSVRPGESGYLGLPSNERGKVVWFGCEQPSLPALTGANPSVGHCQ